MKDLAIELREIADGYDSLSNSASSGSGVNALGAVPRPAGRGPWLIGGAIVAILGIAGLAVGIASLVGRRGAARTDAAPAAGLKITSISGRASVAGVRLSGDGRYLAYSTNPSGTWSLWVRQISTGSEVQVVLPRKKSLSPERFSPNGDYVLFGAEDLDRPGFVAVEQVSTLGGPSRKLLSVLASAGSVSLDGRRVCIVRENPKSAEWSAIVRDIETGQEKTLATIASPLSFQGPFALSPDGKTFVASVHTAEKGIHAQFLAVDTASLAQTRFGPTGWEVVGGQWLPTEPRSSCPRSGTERRRDSSSSSSPIRTAATSGSRMTPTSTLVSTWPRTV